MDLFYTDPQSLFVRAYDAIYREAPPPIAGDVAFYQCLAQRTGGPVLELACGTGRIALPLAESGLDVTGVDVSDGMLSIIRQKAPAHRLTLLAQDMSALNLDRRFGCIIIAFRSFQHLLTIELQRQTLAAIHRHLAPDGRLALHLFDPRLDLLVDQTPRQPVLRGTDPATGHSFTGEMLNARFDYLAQIRRDVWRYREFAPDGSLLAEDTREMALRWTWRWELHHLLELCGFTVEAQYSDFTGSPPAYGKELIVVARMCD
ncbi:MAG TPA: class I SAM-dependent methyltransferase [Acetobacteraceae bacterium]|jgi:ubiquinone/menaquinone biosynthesis C-methylase UbiE|nr:class I SAM-dependent methyltransferase [Acetobacteraceae bacterium]